MIRLPGRVRNFSPIRPSTFGPRPLDSGLALLTADEGRENGLRFEIALLDFELAEVGLPGDVNLVPLIFQGAQTAFVEFAQVSQGGGAGDQSMYFILAGGGSFHGGKNH